MKNLQMINWVALAAVALAAIGFVACSHRTVSMNESAPCVDTATEKCPSTYFSTEVKKLEQLQKDTSQAQLHGTMEEYNAKNDQLLGMDYRLRQMWPQGYRWDNVKHRFIQLPSPPQTPAPPTGGR